MSTTKTFDVAIVGYGPVGATAAALLGQAGLSVYVCDRATRVYETPRALALDHEIMRVFQQIGIVEQIAPYVEAFTPSEYFGVDGQLIRRMTMVAPPYPQGYTPSLVFTQPKIEAALRARVAQLDNVQVALGTELTSLSQDQDRVTLSLRSEHGDPDEEATVRPQTTVQAQTTVKARWLIACDGGASTVRRQADMTLEDLEFDEPWLVVDVLVNDQGLAKLPKTSVQYCEPARPSSFIIGPGNHRRWEISLLPGEDPQHAATAAESWKLLSRWLSPADGVLWRQTSYRFHALVAERWRADRIFVAGDAAHMQPPFLGQGMCQGIRDAVNLSWKLAAVVKGKVRGNAADMLLNSYGHERKEHVRELTRRIKGVGAVICERDLIKARARDARMLADCGGVVQDTPRQDVLPRLESGLLCEIQSSGRGTLFPQARMRSGELMDDRLGQGWRLVMVDTPSVAGDTLTIADIGLCVTDREAELTTVLIGEANLQEAEGVLADWMRRHQCRVALVRPDHYVFGTANTRQQLDGLLNERHNLLAGKISD
jgi:3-(3-hydroxy-phenyl)propionate hydroxylase